MKIPYLGKVSLFWCPSCQVPLLDKFPCNICGQKGLEVKISPPGDIRPAFSGDYKILRDTLDQQFGSGLGEAMVPSAKIVLLNRIGGLDRTDEVIMDGRIIGILRYDIIQAKFLFQPKLIGARYIYKYQQQLGITTLKQIWLNSDALPFIMKGKSVLAPGVTRVSEGMAKDDYCLILTESTDEMASPRCIAVGIARTDSKGMAAMLTDHHGALAKNKEYSKKMPEELVIPPVPIPSPSFKSNPNILSQDILDYSSLELAYRANHTFLAKKIEKSEKFIKQTVESINKPVAVAYSGGKDSLGVLLLVWRALGPNFKIFFADTGLELPEVLENVHLISQTLGMESELIIKSAGEKFWEIVENFGPPGRDFRFCCHSLKAQQIMDLINTMYGGEKVLSFLGQRQYESLSRAQSKTVYVNTFIPLQIAATPIKKWNSLTLWLFLLFEPVFDATGEKPLDVPITRLYFQGQERLGCYLCPAASLASFSLLKETHPKMMDRWQGFLENYAQKHGLPSEWISLGLWRFKRLNPQWQNIVDSLGISLTPELSEDLSNIQLHIAKGFSPCLQDGYSVKGRFSRPLDLESLMNYMPALTSQIDYDAELNVISLKGVFKRIDYKLNLFADGSFFLHSLSKDFNYEKVIIFLATTLYRANLCNHCGTCTAICVHKAIITLENGIRIDPDLCKNCQQCITHCPFYANAKELEF